MSSLILAQRQKQPLTTNPGLGIKIDAVESRITSISLTTAKKTHRVSVTTPFDFKVDMNETGRTAYSLNVRYAFSFGNSSSGQLCRMNGDAVVRFSQFNPDTDFGNLGSDITNEIAVEIFRKNYASVYLLHDALSMDLPSPWIYQDVSLSSRQLLEDNSSQSIIRSAAGPST